MNKSSRIFIAGHNGILGRAITLRLRKEGFRNLIVKPPGLNLTNQEGVGLFFKKERPHYCFLPSIAEGGIEANVNFQAELIYKNLATQNNVIHSACKAKVRKLIFFASSCVYPKVCPQPMKEDYLLRGPLEPTNEAYAISKISGIKTCQAYNRQFGTNFISIIPATIFGPGDNFDLKTSHVIPALIRKFYEGRKKGSSRVVIWGTGTPRREFIYIDDIVDASLFIMRHHSCPDIINVGTGTDISIKGLAGFVQDITGFKGKIEFDSTKPDGSHRKLLDSGKINSLGWRAKTDLKTALKTTFSFYGKKRL